MINKIKKHTIFSILFLIVALIIFFLKDVIDRDYYRNFLGIMTVYVFYPSVLMSVFFSIKNLTLISADRNIVSKHKWTILNFLSIAFAIFFVIKIVLVMNEVV